MNIIHRGIYEQITIKDFGDEISRTRLMGKKKGVPLYSNLC